MSSDSNLVETVKLLDNVASDEASNQRALASKIGISVGLVNALMRRAVRKGLIKIKEVPTRRYAYFLTPKGFAEKSRLVADYLDISLAFFRTARQEYSELFERCSAAGKTRVVLCGAGELAEIAILSANAVNLELVGVLDFHTNQERIAGLNVLRDLSKLNMADALVITDGRMPQKVYDELTADVGHARVYAPAFLRISQRQGSAAQGTK